MTCREMEAILPALAEKEGPPRVALEAARHLASCGGCAELLLRLRILHGMLDSLPSADVPPSFARRVLRVLPGKGKTSAGLAFIAGLVLLGGTVSMTSPFGSAPGGWLDPLEAATSALSACLRTAFELLALLRAAPPVAGLEATYRSGVGLPAGGYVVALACFAAASLAASGAAFGRGAIRLRRERRRLQ